MAAAPITLYDVLGVPMDATDARIHSAYRRRLVRVHPATFASADNDSFAFKTDTEEAAAKELHAAVERAHRVLSHPSLRKWYDEQLLGPAAAAAHRRRLRLMRAKGAKGVATAVQHGSDDEEHGGGAGTPGSAAAGRPLQRTRASGGVASDTGEDRGEGVESATTAAPPSGGNASLTRALRTRQPGATPTLALEHLLDFEEAVLAMERCRPSPAAAAAAHTQISSTPHSHDHRRPEHHGIHDKRGSGSSNPSQSGGVSGETALGVGESEHTYHTPGGGTMRVVRRVATDPVTGATCHQETYSYVAEATPAAMPPTLSEGSPRPASARADKRDAPSTDNAPVETTSTTTSGASPASSPPATEPTKQAAAALQDFDQRALGLLPSRLRQMMEQVIGAPLNSFTLSAAPVEAEPVVTTVIISGG